MKALFSNAILILAVRVFLGALFVIASLDKITDVQAFASSILNYKVIEGTLATIAATALPWLELLCGLGLIIGFSPRGSAFMITAMLVVFTLLVASAMFRGLDISCGCFTQDPNADKIGWQKILENCGMIVLAVYLLLARDQNIGWTRLFARQVGTKTL